MFRTNKLIRTNIRTVVSPLDNVKTDGHTDEKRRQGYVFKEPMSVDRILLWPARLFRVKISRKIRRTRAFASSSRARGTVTAAVFYWVRSGGGGGDGGKLR